MMGNEALVVFTNLSQLMSTKIDKPMLHVTGWVNVRIKIAVVRSYSRVLRGALYPSPLRTQKPEWSLVLVLGLVQ